MKKNIAYLAVIMIWSTTPLAIKWSSEGVEYLMALSARIALGLVGACVILLILRQLPPVNRQAVKTYLTSGFSIYFAMMGVYWASQHIPSGWISVIFGLSPIMTGVLAALILHERSITIMRLVGMMLGIIGLIIIFGDGYSSGGELFEGILVVLGSTLVHSLSSVLVKSFNARLSGFSASAGGLAFAMPLFIVTCICSGVSIPQSVPDRALISILYLGIIASTFGFALYYYVLSHMDIGQVSLIPLITPVSALLLGNLLNDEPVSITIMMGAGFITAGLLFYQFGQNLLQRLLDTDKSDYHFPLIGLSGIRWRGRGIRR